MDRIVDGVSNCVMVLVILDFWTSGVFPDEGGHAVEPLWSVDPACALSMYYSQSLAAVKVQSNVLQYQ